MSIAVIFNPHARKNRHHERRVLQMQKQLGGDGSVYLTASLEEIDAALRQADARGEHHLLIDGGDGAVHWVVNEAIRIWGIDEVAQRFVFITGRGGTIDYLSMAIGTSGKSPAILRALQQQVRSGELEIFEARTMSVRGVQIKNGREEVFQRYGWAFALAGYGANFYGPWYRDETLNGTLRILTLLAEAFTTAAFRPLFSDRFSDRKPAWLARNEHDFLRPFLGKVLVDGQPFRGNNNDVLSSFRVVHAGSVPVDLGGVIKVFHQATSEQFHVHVGDLSPSQVPPVLWQAARAKPLTGPNFYDGPASSLELQPDAGVTLVPSIDGELFDDVGPITIQLAGTIRFARIRA